MNAQRDRNASFLDQSHHLKLKLAAMAPQFGIHEIGSSQGLDMGKMKGCRRYSGGTFAVQPIWRTVSGL